MDPRPRTKIVCTLGPSTDHPEILRAMIRAGMSAARINFSHGDHQAHARRIAMMRQVAQEEGATIALLGDLQGPRWRVGDIEGGYVSIEPGQQLILTSRLVRGNPREIHLPHPELIALIRPGQILLLDDGLLEFRVEDVQGSDVVCRVVRGGTLSSHKGINAPGLPLTLPALTEKDRLDVKFAVEHEADYLALSFVRTAEDVCQLRLLLQELRASIPIIAKIEKREALENFEAILEVADAVMVARGDLGVEIPPEEVPIHQKRIIRRCNRAGKPVITATQMLNSMVNHPRPTRAEASDVANAILDGTDAVMLSAETATGTYPVEAVQMIARIARIAEGAMPHRQWLDLIGESTEVTEAISRATVEIAEQVGARVIVTSTMSGYTARMIARHRPSVPILAATPVPATLRRLALVWGVEPVLMPPVRSTDEMLGAASQAALQGGFAQLGDLIVITAGVPFGCPGRTNFLKVHRIDLAPD
ncbi:MAG: pyruvate kinase [Anaerolineae bacterium]|nr:pyruvate kinase [Thermoflexus sp.]MDW8065036.1 pyruvate kinase [Anaerolineae bacterium]